MTALTEALTSSDPSVRLRAVMQAGLDKSPADIETLIERCAVEPDFQVREMLTWALIRHPANTVLPRLLDQLTRSEPQARQQALHTLSKLRQSAAWPSVRPLLDDPDRDVMRTAWYTAVALAPSDDHAWLAQKLATGLGQGDGDIQRSLGRALANLGEETIRPVLDAAIAHDDPSVRQHVEMIERLLEDTESGFTSSLADARREVALGRTRSTKG